MSHFSRLANAGVQVLKPYAPGKPIEELERELGLTDIVKLASNENPLGPSPNVKAMFADWTGDFARYPDGAGFALKTQLAAHLSVKPEQITLGNGSNDCLELIARCFLGPQKSALFSEYAFAVYPLATMAANAQFTVAAAHAADAEMPLGHDLDAFLAAISDETTVIFIANPNNPTGTWLPPQDIQAFLAAVPKNMLVVLDEAYFEYLPDELQANSVAWLAQYPNLIITRTFSKIYGLAGLRIGYALSSPEVADLLNRVRQPFNNNVLALAAAECALQDQAHVMASQAMNTAGLQQLQAACNARGIEYLPSVANFLTIRTGKNTAELIQGLLQQGVIVRDLVPYKMPEYMRVTVGTQGENERFIQVLDQVMDEVRT